MGWNFLILLFLGIVSSLDVLSIFQFDDLDEFASLLVRISTMSNEKCEVLGFRTTQIDQIFPDGQVSMLGLESLCGTSIFYD